MTRFYVTLPFGWVSASTPAEAAAKIVTALTEGDSFDFNLATFSVTSDTGETVVYPGFAEWESRVVKNDYFKQWKMPVDEDD